MYYKISNIFFCAQMRTRYNRGGPQQQETKEGMEEFRQNFSTLPVSINVSMPEAQVHATCNVGSQFTMGMFCCSFSNLFFAFH